MFVHKLKPKESVYLNDGEIVVTLVEVLPGGARVGIAAPKDILIERASTYHDRKVAEGRPPRIGERATCRHCQGIIEFVGGEHWRHTVIPSPPHSAEPQEV